MPDNYGREWNEVPALAITKSGVSFNTAFVNAFVSDNRRVLVMLDKKGRRVGVKFAQEDQFDQAYTLKKNTGTKNTKVLRISTNKVGKEFPDALMRAYRVSLTDERVLVASITEENRLK